ncbi:MAG: polyprenol phosphomannose-dependent alpha 1,6 mannosyltransferase MptB [Micrococcaceae bacterium]
MNPEILEERQRTHRALILGFWGSLCLLIASWALGKIPQAVNTDFPWIMHIRQSLNLTFLFVLLAVFGAVLHVIAWAKLATSMKKWNDSSLTVVKQAALCWTLPLFFSFPMFSDDVFAYFAQGRLMYNGLDPYTTGISALPNWRAQGVSEMWTESPTPYGPLFLLIELIVVILSHNNVAFGVIGFKIAALVGILLCYVYIPKVAKQNGINPAKATWLTIANPLFSFAFMISAHNDALMMGLLVAGIYYVLDKKFVLGIIIVSASIAIKPIALLSLPFLGLIWARHYNPYPNSWFQIKTWIVTALLGFVPVIVLGLIIGVPPGWVQAFTTPGQTFSFYAPVSYLVYASSFIAGSSGATVVKAVFAFLTVCIILRLIFMDGTPRSILQRCTLAFAVTVALSPVIYGWYVLWVIILFAISFEHNDKYTLPLIYLSVLYTMAPFAEPMDVSVLVDGLGLVRLLAIACMFGSCYWLIFKDKSMKLLYQFERQNTQQLKHQLKYETPRLQNPLVNAQLK